jgi:MoxR-like ATPase
VKLAASPRASLALMKTAQALSIFEGRDFVLPETIQELAADVIAHRLVLSPDAKYAGVTGRSIVAELLETIPVPV